MFKGYSSFYSSAQRKHIGCWVGVYVSGLMLSLNVDTKSQYYKRKEQKKSETTHVHLAGRVFF